MNILVCNDDGYLAPGLEVLERVASEFANITVVAPERDKSGVSKSLTLDAPLKIKQAPNGYYFVNGTPIDCIHLAMHQFPNLQPKVVLTGINNGANLGDDTLYSGTVAAATQAYLQGIPAIALSMCQGKDKYWDTAEKATKMVLQFLFNNFPVYPFLWSINIPAIKFEDIKGIRVTRLGTRHHQQSIIPAQNPKGETIYWIGPAGNVADGSEDTDFYGIKLGFITITPLTIDLTHYSDMKKTDLFWKKANW